MRWNLFLSVVVVLLIGFLPASVQSEEAGCNSGRYYKGCPEIDPNIQCVPSCSDCPPGTYDGIGYGYQSYCELCPIGKYQDEEGQTECKTLSNQCGDADCEENEICSGGGGSGPNCQARENECQTCQLSEKCTATSFGSVEIYNKFNSPDLAAIFEAYKTENNIDEVSPQDDVLYVCGDNNISNVFHDCQDGVITPYFENGILNFQCIQKDIYDIINRDTDFLLNSICDPACQSDAFCYKIDFDQPEFECEEENTQYDYLEPIEEFCKNCGPGNGCGVHFFVGLNEASLVFDEKPFDEKIQILEPRTNDFFTCVGYTGASNFCSHSEYSIVPAYVLAKRYLNELLFDVAVMTQLVLPFGNTQEDEQPSESEINNWKTSTHEAKKLLNQKMCIHNKFLSTRSAAEGGELGIMCDVSLNDCKAGRRCVLVRSDEFEFTSCICESPNCDETDFEDDMDGGGSADIMGDDACVEDPSLCKIDRKAVLPWWSFALGFVAIPLVFSFVLGMSLKKEKK